MHDERGSVLESGTFAGKATLGATTHAAVDGVLQALRYIGVEEQNIELVLGNHSTPKPKCANYTRKFSGDGVKDSAAYYGSLLGQLEARKRCQQPRRK